MTQRSTTEIGADLVDYRAARSALVKGERVEDIWEDGARMKLAGLSLADINAAIADLEREYEAASQAEAGRPRRRAISLRWSN
ncbi:hypothetical protein GRI97_08145 [Altererythrobacter xixiisoli]|uniref:GpW protein n=1 Tax=Croceibacterium xixiisoli TaxID=1476466 RepID=A0A6I4TVY6_9SPHN|nr:hypothetical protein [Croceibacterium xixiisoli]MXO98957.1 hypothetical protein [Croceibacterium xixiisoli]